MKKIRYFYFLLFFSIFFNTYGQDTLISEGQIPILGWYGIPAEETTVARYQEMKDAGFTHNFSFLGNNDNVQKALDTAEAVGMKVIISCNELGNDPENTVARFMNHPALAGYFLRDEPSKSDFPALATWAKRIQAVDSLHYCYLNLNPNYARESNLGTSSYRDYVSSFIEQVPLKFYSYDHYPIRGDSIIHTFRPEFYDNLEIFSDETKKVGKPFWAFAMSVAIYNIGYPDPTTPELRLQMFSDLAYGAQGLQFFTYWTPGCGSECFSNGPIYNGQRMPVYYKVQEVSKEIKGLSGIFLGSTVVSVRHTGTLPQGTTKLSELPEQIKVFETIGKGAVVSVQERDSLAFLVVVNKDFQDSMKLIIKGDPTLKRVMKDGTLIPSAISTLTTLVVGPGDIVAFTWEKGDSITFLPIKNNIVNLPLDFDLKDFSGNGFNATDAGPYPVSFVSDPERGKVASFEDGAYAVLPGDTLLNFGEGDFSFAVWVKCPPSPGKPVILGNKNGSDNTLKGFSLYLNNADTPGSKMWGANFADGNNKLTWEASDNGVPGIANNQWHMVAVSFERENNMDVYLDGHLMPGSLSMASCQGYAHDDANNYPITIMQDGTGTNVNSLSGYIDRLRIWNRALADVELSDLYSSDTTGVEGELVYLPLDNDLTDASGNGLDASDAGKVPTAFVDDPVRGRVAYFDRTAHAVLPKIDLLRFGPGQDFSFSLWLKCSPAPYNPPILCNKKWDVGRRKGFALYTNESNISSGQKWSVNFGDGEIEEGGSGNNLRWYAANNGVPSISDEQWHFIAVSFDRDKTMDIFLDGEQMPGSMELTPCPGYAYDDVGDYPITLMQDGTGKFYMDIPAYIDDLRIWDRTIDPTEVSSLYSHELTTEVHEVSIPSSPDILVYPNPTNGLVNIIFNSEIRENARIILFNNMGIIMKDQSLSTIIGQNKVTFDTNTYNSGIYFIRLISGNNSETIRLVITK